MMKNAVSGRLFTILFCLVLSFVLLSGAISAADGPSVYGQLHVEPENGRLLDASGRTVQLKGVSTHGLTWFPEFISGELFRQLAEDWGANLIRLAMYSKIYCGGGQEESLALMKKGIDAAIAADLYVIVDWHILEDSDPNLHIDEAVRFFDQISAEYAGSRTCCMRSATSRTTTRPGKTLWITAAA